MFNFGGSGFNSFNNNTGFSFGTMPATNTLSTTTPFSSQSPVSPAASTELKPGGTHMSLMNNRMLKIQQREKLTSAVRQEYCGVHKQSIWGASPSRDTLKKQEPVSSGEPATNETTPSENIIQTAVKSSRDFIRRLKQLKKVSSDKRRKMVPLSSQLRDLAMLVASLDMEWNSFPTILETTQRFRRLLSIERNPPIEEVINSGAVPYFVQYLDFDEVSKYFNVDYVGSATPPPQILPHDPNKKSIAATNLHQLQFEATWAITNIASGTAEHTRYIVGLDCIPRMINLLDSESDDLKQQSVWALGNISGDSHTLRDLVLSQGAMPKVLQLIGSEASARVKRDATWTLSNMFRGKPAPNWEYVVVAIPMLSQLLFSTDEDILIDACWAVSYASDGPSDRIQAIIDSGATRRLVELLLHHNASVQTPALRAVGNIVTGDDTQTAAVLNCGLLPCLSALFTHPKKSMRKEVMWTVSNITAGTQGQIQMVIDAGLIPKMISILVAGSESFDVTKEAYWALANTCEGGNDEQIRYMVDQGVVQPFCNGLNVGDQKIIAVALEGLSAVLRSSERIGILEQVCTSIEECGGLDRIESLQTHQNESIYSSCVSILESYFAAEEEDTLTLN